MSETKSTSSSAKAAPSGEDSAKQLAMEKKRTKVLKAALKEERVKFANLENDLSNANA
jgi:hypothetical protein